MQVRTLIIAALAGCAFLSAGCQREDPNEHHYDNKLFIAASTFTQEIRFTNGSGVNLTEGLSFGIAKPEDHDIAVRVEASPGLVDTYKQAYGDEDVIALPAGHYNLPQDSTVIQAGSVTSATLPVEFTDIGELDVAQAYVLPVTISSVEGIDVLESAKRYYYVFRGASLVNVVCDIKENRAYPEWKDGSIVNNMSQNTAEILCKASAFPNTLHTLMGVEGKYLIRIGDAPIANNQLQVAASKNLTNTDLQLETGRWYHIAVTFDRGDVKVYIDGVEKASGNVGTTTVNWGAPHTNEENGDRCFWVGYSYQSSRYFDGQIAEARIWNRVLPAEEIQSLNHFYSVDPASEGLVAYWKFNDGTGSVAKDYSVNGNDLTIEKEPLWVPVSLPQ
ncbi:MAG: DUF1735 and LamG domain-containing protein [Mediterranea sp.]|jgi:hypothetical protein|nr:DUF1735 and LamG domain-containing protein [Mediterranea sp.]